MNTYNSLVDLIRNFIAEDNKGITFIESDNDKFISYKQLYRKSLGILYNLQSLGIKSRDEVVFQIEDNEEFLCLFWACILGGIIPVPISIGNNFEHNMKLFKVWEILTQPYMVSSRKNLAKLEKFAQNNNLDNMMSTLNERSIFIEDIIETTLTGKIYESDLDSLAFIQFSSGSTGDPKGILLTHKNLLENIYAINMRLKTGREDSMISWMPLTHDMGLIAVHLTGIAAGINEYLMPTSLFIRRPRLWIEKVHQYRVTQLYSPNFGLKYFLLSHQTLDEKKWDLSCVRYVVNGAEPISVELCKTFLNAMSTYGLKWSSMYPVYGLAEGTIAVCLPPAGEEFNSVTVDRNYLGIGEAIKVVRENEGATFADVGYSVDSCEVRVCGAQGEVLKDSMIGYIQIKGRSVTTGYYNNKKATAEIFTEDGWLITGDLGFMVDGRFVVTGRAKDIIFVNGQNYYPHDIERVAENVEGIGKTAACGFFNDITQQEEILLFVLFKKSIKDFIPIKNNLETCVFKYIGLAIDKVIPVKKIPQTTSGKIQRYKLSEMYRNGQFSSLVQEINELSENIFDNDTKNFRNETQRKLIKILQRVLKVNNIGLDDNMFELNADLTSTMQIVLLIEQEFNMDISFDDALLKSSVAELAELIYIEERLVKMWKKVFELDKIGINDEFFNLGGDSLQAQRLLNNIEKEFKIKIPIRDFFAESVISNIGGYILGKQKDISINNECEVVHENYNTMYYWSTVQHWEIEENRIRIGSQYYEGIVLDIFPDFYFLMQKGMKLADVYNKYSYLKKHEELTQLVSNLINNKILVTSILTINQLLDHYYDLKEHVDKTNESYPSSSAQKGVYVVQQLEEDSISYNNPLVMRINGQLDLGKFENAMRKLVSRHETLRTAFEFLNGELIQKIQEDIDLKIYCQEVNEFDINEILKDFVKPFDLSLPPLFRIKLLKLSPDMHILLLDAHHIIVDGLSTHLFINELASLYKNKILPQIKVSYKDYCILQHEYQKTGLMKKQEKYWMKRFSGEIPVLSLDTDYPRPAHQSYEGSLLKFNIDRELTLKLKNLASNAGATLYMIILAAYNVLLSRYSGQEDIIVGSPFSGRLNADFENIIGMFSNTLAMRNYPEGSKTFVEFLKEVKENTLEAYENQEYPFLKLVNNLNIQRDISRNPLFDTMFSLQNMEDVIVKIDIDGLSFTSFEFFDRITKFDVVLEAYESKEGVHFVLKYCTKLFSETRMEKFVSHFYKILNKVAENCHIKLRDIEMLSDDESNLMLNVLNNTKVDYFKDKTIHELFEDCVEKNVDQTALVFGECKVSYGELNRKANQFAHRLRDIGVGKESIVGLMVRRSIDMIVGIIGILKAGGAYLPIDPEYPEERIRYMLEDSNACTLVIGKDLKEQSIYRKNIIIIDDAELKQMDDSNPSVIKTSENLAYVIYTSGSTGRPKGVMIKEQSVNNFIEGITDRIEFLPGKAILALTTISFDIFLLETLLPLCTGLKVVIADEMQQRDPDELCRLIIDNNIRLLQATPSGMQMLFSSNLSVICLSKLETIMIGGEAFPENMLKRLQEITRAKIYNMYGPTETTIWSTVQDLTCRQKVDIGKPIANTRLYILNKYNRLQPWGVAGELCIAGDGLARGYINKNELSRKTFVIDPFYSGELMYRTGDVARWQEDGNIHLLGRIDSQVKVRGFRIELGEIETAILEHVLIKEATVVDRDGENGEKYICAYIVSDENFSADILRKQLMEKLPTYMVPTFFVQIESIPRTLNGKIDKKHLPNHRNEMESTKYIAPRNYIENTIVNIWREILCIEKVSINDNFFKLGGHSLKAVALVSELHKRFNVKINLRDIFINPTIEEIGNLLNNAKLDGFMKIIPTQMQDYYQVSSAQKQMYLLNQISNANICYNIPQVVIIEGDLDVRRIENAYKKIIKRHEALRTSFVLIDREPMQVIHHEVQCNFNYSELNGESLDKLITRFVQPFDLGKAPLLRAEIVKLDETKYALMMDVHHIISDGISNGILLKEIRALYDNVKLKEVNLQYKDFAAWQNEALKSDYIKEQEKYWLNVFSGEISLLNIPTDYGRSTSLDLRGSIIRFNLDEALTTELKNLSLKTNTTLFSVLFATYNVLLYMYCSQEDIIVGIPVAGRKYTEFNNTVGMFVNTIAYRSHPKGTKTFVGFLDEVKESLLYSLENQDYPFENLVDKLNIERELGRNPLFDTCFSMLDSDNFELSLKDLKVYPYNFNVNVAKFDITLYGYEAPDKVNFIIEYKTSLFKKETIERISQHYIEILRQVVKNKNIKINDIEISSKLLLAKSIGPIKEKFNF